MRAPAPAAFLAASLLGLPHGALASVPTTTPGQCNTGGLYKINSDTCLQRVFLSSPDCNTLDPSYNNETLPAAGFYCCWKQGPFVGPPALPTSAWLQINENGDVTQRCLTSGSCTEYYNLPDYNDDCRESA